METRGHSVGSVPLKRIPHHRIGRAKKRGFWNRVIERHLIGFITRSSDERRFHNACGQRPRTHIDRRMRRCLVRPLRPRLPNPERVTLELNVRVIELGLGESETVCEHCQEPLNLHQPDESLPSQLLATCGSCSRWFSLVGVDAEGSEYLMVELPSRSQLEVIRSKRSGAG
jgi:hypothetical protein